MKPMLFAATGLALASCATAPVDPALQVDAERPIYCRAGSDCEAKWSRAITWVVRNSEMRIQTQTDTLVQTYQPESSAKTTYTVLRTSVGSGRYVIQLEAGCRTWVCFPDPLKQRASFARFVDPN